MGNSTRRKAIIIMVKMIKMIMSRWQKKKQGQHQQSWHWSAGRSWNESSCQERQHGQLPGHISLEVETPIVNEMYSPHHDLDLSRAPLVSCENFLSPSVSRETLPISLLSE